MLSSPSPLSTITNNSMTSPSSYGNAHAPRYDLGLNPPYQINHRAKRCGKTITATKRRITFQFGFSSADAVRRGMTEADCRGEEHEVVLIWSHMTGKRQLFMDGREFHSSRAARGNTRFEHSWSIPGNHTLKVVANAAPPITAEGARQFKQFDLELDGMSYFDFKRIYELGIATTTGGGGVIAGTRGDEDDVPRQALPAMPTYSYRGAAYDARDDDAEEDETYARRPLLAPPQAVDLLDMSSSAAIECSSSIQSLLCVTNSDSFTQSTSFHYCHDEFAPVENGRPSFDSISNEILGAYNHCAPNPPVAHAAPSSCRALVPLSEEGMDPVSRSISSLVNLDDINHTPDLRHAFLRSSRAAATPSVPGSWGGQVGRAPTLAEMREAQSSSPTMSARSVMKVNDYNPQAGYYQQPQALVPIGGASPSSSHDQYGNTQMHYGKAPLYGFGNPGQYGY